MRRAPRLPIENLAAPLTGYKLAKLLHATDGRSVAFAGLSVGSRRVYTTVDEAECAITAKHSPPDHRGNCGFYCVHTADAARALASTETYRDGVLLEVSASGRFIRYEEGLRYQKQRVRAVRVGLCGCGRRAEVFVAADTGADLAGWRRLLAVCQICAGLKPQVGRDRIAALLPGVPVTLDEGVCPLDDLPVPSDAWAAGAETVLLSAEVALLQARLDAVQTRLASMEEPGRRPPAAD